MVDFSGFGWGELYEIFVFPWTPALLAPGETVLSFFSPLSLNIPILGFLPLDLLYHRVSPLSFTSFFKTSCGTSCRRLGGQHIRPSLPLGPSLEDVSSKLQQSDEPMAKQILERYEKVLDELESKKETIRF